jgi:radical SAM protein with 4Fe4S-binding SPASM domain
MNIHYLKKILNYKLVELQKRLKTKTVIGYPYKLVIDTVDVCDLKCIFCPTGQRKATRPKSILSYEGFKNTINKLGPYLLYIDFFNWGEPLLNKDIYKMILYAKRHNINCSVSTNFNCFESKNAEDMIWSGLDYLFISIDGTNQKSYEKYQVGGDFKKVIENIKALVKSKKELNSSTPYIQWQFVVFKHNEKEIPDAIKIAGELGIDNVKFIPAYIYDIQKNFDAWIPDDEKYSYYKKTSTSDTNKIEFSPEFKGCDFPWTTIVLDAGGNVFPCCGDIDIEHSFGNINSTAFNKIWNGKIYRTAREFISSGKIRKDTEICCYKCLNVSENKIIGM